MTYEEILEKATPYIEFLKQNGFESKGALNSWTYGGFWVCDLYTGPYNDKLKPYIYKHCINDASIIVYDNNIIEAKDFNEFKKEMLEFIKLYKKAKVQQKIVGLEKDFI